MLRSESVGPAVGQEVATRAAGAIALAALGIMAYITYAFRGVPHAFRYGIAAIIAMLHDVLVVIGFEALFGHFLGWQVDSLFLTALLTVIGFSVHDTIVVFDRISLVRERLAPAAPKGRMLEAGIGYLELAELPARASEEARAQLDALKRAGARQLVLDLRGSSWGAPSEAPRIAELFMKGGVVARRKSRRGEDQLLQADPGRTQWDQPLAVLIDSGTAGAGEIVASALRESGRATLVGERSFGRAAVQRAVPLPEGGLVLTTAKYANAKGEPIHGKGVEPSVVVETAEPSEDEPAAPADPVLDKALELLKAGEKKAA